jgi:hypothetical protein
MYGMEGVSLQITRARFLHDIISGSFLSLPSTAMGRSRQTPLSS